MENPEGVLNLLDEFAKLKSKEIPNDLEEYLLYVAASGDPVYQWSLIKSLYRQKLINVITEFYEMCPVLDIPRCPNVDPFNYETMKNSLLKRLDSFSSAPFTIQRISELLTTPRKQYNRVDKFMRAIEKNIWVVSTREPGPRESINAQEASTNLVNGVTPRVCVTVKHPKRVKSIEERIKSGHPQLIDDDEEEDEDEEEEIDDYEQMEEETSTEILPANDTDETSLQCTSVKNLIEKYENGTIFSNTEEKSEFEEKSTHLEEASTEPTVTVIPESEVDTESVPPSSDLPSSDESSKSTPAPEFVQKNTAETTFSELKKEAAPVVAADSSSDITAQERELKTVEEPSVLDSTSDISVEESQIVNETSTPSSSELSVTKGEAVAAVADTQPESSNVSSEEEKVQPASESSLETITDSNTKDIVGSVENEYI